MADTKRLSLAQVVAGAAAAASSAVLLSTLGVSGTIIGAAVGSIVASVASHMYARGLQASREQALALRRLAQAREDIERVAAHPEEDAEAPLEHADTVLGRASSALEARPTVNWRHAVLLALGMFLGVMAAITAFELVAGQALSSMTGGSDKGTRTTIRGGNHSTPAPTVTVTQTPTPTPTRTVTLTPTGTPTPTASPTPTESPSATPTESPTVTDPATAVPGESPSESPGPG